MKFVKCKECRGKGKKTYTIPLYDYAYHEADDYPIPVAYKRRKEICRVCYGSLYEKCVKASYTSIKSETPLAYQFIIDGKEVWIAKSIIAKKADNYIIVPHWTNFTGNRDQAVYDDNYQEELSDMIPQFF